MGYRGEDLDLRTPQTWLANPAETSSGPSIDNPRTRPMLQQGTGRAGPIWVDDVVLACSNHAFDVALAHRSTEVRLEHLIHALTRVDPAAEVLEAFGLRVQVMRRDSALAIASDIPAGLSNGKTVPRRSDELEDVLRTAAGIASRRNAPASVEDLLQVMLEATADLPGLQLIQRSLSARPIVNTYAEVMPPMARNPYSYDPLDTGRDRLRGVYQSTDMMRSAAPAPIDSVQNSRLDALEQMVRTLGLDLQNERKMLASAMQDVQREIVAQRDDNSRLSGGLQDRLQSALTDRLQALENAVVNIRPGNAPDLAPLFDRVSAIERSVQAALQSVGTANQTTADAVSEKLSGLMSRSSTIDLQPITNRLDIIEEAVLNRDSDPAALLAGRFDTFTNELAVERRRSAEVLSAILAELKTTSNAMAEAVRGQLDRQRSEIAVSVITPLTDRVNTLSAAIEGRDEDVARDFGTVRDRLSSVEKAFAAATQKSVELAQLADARSADVQKSHAQDLSEVHDALMKLNANQHTLAGSVDQWRKDGTAVLGGLGEKLGILGANVDGFGTRLGGLEKEAGKPMQMLEALSGTMDNMHKVTVERYYRRNRFWFWLFGTDDWVAASWPSHAQRIAEDLKMVKTVARARI